jgi:hypothetical protein
MQKGGQDMNNTRRLSRRRKLKGFGAALAALGLLATRSFGKPGSVYANQAVVKLIEQAAKAVG